jgi:apolipoprotein N-acyltransferase
MCRREIQRRQGAVAIKLYQDAITAAPADLIATPETAIVMLPQQLPPDYLAGIAQFLNAPAAT